MSFSYNENLVMGTCVEAMEVLHSIDKEEILRTIQLVAKEEVTTERLHKEFVDNFKGFKVNPGVTGEYIKNYFAIGLEGVQKVLENLSKQHTLLTVHTNGILFEDVFSYIDEMLDEVDFDNLFHQERLALVQ
ncbi:hypothetical protein PP175_27740 (plasmid) [Aneurinibacillus sp. Ricciae_BoGa-3]|uniref:hypothetical protein n=1 Tax=Aneurinibacillus sp. Ricciae_BoGa-3 TaxID=3022697 RepID=UPI00233FB27B|nr:hypothetical protein [Aneurinibacillus sp. Ricciae_BoGa-3]WCK56986.1 hypothetical protein PP175_27740 [Aneurinibacillus sp. Ricciae_BoGa-3]